MNEVDRADDLADPRVPLEAAPAPLALGNGVDLADDPPRVPLEAAPPLALENGVDLADDLAPLEVGSEVAPLPGVVEVGK